jgi:hypothetical protein
VIAASREGGKPNRFLRLSRYLAAYPTKNPCRSPICAELLHMSGTLRARSFYIWVESPGSCAGDTL